MRRRPAPASLPVTRLPFLEGLRGLAALYVVLSHFCTMADGRRLAGQTSEAPLWLYRTMGTFWYGNLAVAAFIVLSGFCLQLSLFHRADGRIANLRVFYLRRARRILPPYYAALFLSIGVALGVTQYQTGPPFTYYVPVNTENVVAHLLLVHNFSPAWMFKINGVLWSIAIEAQLYVIFPLLVLSFLRFGRGWVVIASAILAAIIFAVVPVAPKLYPWYLPLFVLGMFSAHVAFRPSLRKGTLPWIARAAGLAALGGGIGSCVQDSPIHVQDSLIGIAVASLCYVLTTTDEGGLNDLLAWRPIVALGGFSYSLYLIHHPIQQIVYVFRPGFVQGPLLGVLYLLAVGLPLILLGAYAFHLAFERPFMPRRPVTKLDLLPPFMPVSLPLRTYRSGDEPVTTARIRPAPGERPRGAVAAEI